MPERADRRGKPGQPAHKLNGVARQEERIAFAYARICPAPEPVHGTTQEHYRQPDCGCGKLPCRPLAWGKVPNRHERQRQQDERARLGMNEGDEEPGKQATISEGPSHLTSHC